jgi:hypothetical protein
LRPQLPKLFAKTLYQLSYTPKFLKSKTHKIERASRTKTCNPKLKHKPGERQQRKV